MPKVRRSRVKLHDLAPGSARLDSATACPDRLSNTTTGNGNGDNSSYSVGKYNPVSFLCGASSPPAHTDGTTPGARDQVCRGGLGVSPPAAASQSGTADNATTPMKSLSRGQRRRAEKRDAWLRKFEFAKYAQKLRKEHQRQQQDDHQQQGPLGTFAAALRQQLHDDDACCSTEDGISSTDRTTARGWKRVTRRSIQHLAEKEIAQYNAVVGFPAFRANPLAVLKEHLQNTISIQNKTKRNV